MIWRAHTLYREPGADAIADVDVDGDGDVLRFGCRTLRFSSMSPAYLRAASDNGEMFTLRKRSLTVSRYSARCGTASGCRDYTVHRVGVRGRREIRNAEGELLALTTPRPDGALEVEAYVEPTVDLVFITWGLTYVDAAVRRTYY